jgi:hypothetical protein
VPELYNATTSKFPSGERSALIPDLNCVEPSVSQREVANDMDRLLVPTKRLARRLLVHSVRFAVLAVGALAAVELMFTTWACLKDFERVRKLSDVADCANMVGFFLTWLPYVAIHLTLAGILAFVGTVLWAWRDRRRS